MIKLKSQNLSPSNYHLPSTKNGFTIIELIIVMVIISILATITFVSYGAIKSRSVTETLKLDIQKASSQIALFKANNGGYPATESEIDDGKGLSKSANTTYQYIVSGSSYCLAATSTQSGGATFHTTSATNGSIQEGACPEFFVVPPTNLTASTVSRVSINVSWDAVPSATSYELHRSIDSSFTNPTIVRQVGVGLISSGLSQGSLYYYRVRALDANGYSEWSNTANAMTTIDVPVAPNATANTVTTTTTWSWNTPTCPAGTSAQYQYRYTITPAGSDSGWVAIAASPVAFTTTTEMQTYTVQVQARCYTSSTVSIWSGSGQASYYRPGTWKQIATGDYHNCAIASNNLAYCWGWNASGQLGNNSTIDSWVPVAVNTTNGISALYGKTIKYIAGGVGYHTCAIASDDLAYCWGDNSTGALGNNSTTNSLVPVAVDRTGVLSGKTIKDIQVSHGWTCAIASDDLPYCWGDGDLGHLGDNYVSGIQSNVPVAVYTAGVLSGKTVKDITAAASCACVIASDNLEYCWGHNASYGKLGNNSTADFFVPVAVDRTGVLSGKTVIAMSGGGNHNCGIASDGKGFCMGMNTFGEVGNNAMTTDQRVPATVYATGVLNGLTLKSIAASDDSTCAIASNNLVYCWGDNRYGQVGDNSTSNRQVPVAVNMTNGVSALYGKTILSIGNGGGYYHICAIASDNLVYCWGYNNHGQLGIGSSDSNPHSVPVGPISPP